MYLQELRGEVSQGDIFDDLPIVYATRGSQRFASTAMRSLLVTYDCEYDKPSTRLVMAAGIFSLADVPADRRGNVRRDKVFSTFSLEATAAFDEAFADFRCAGLLEKAIVATRAETRLFSLGDAARLALQEQLSSFFGHGRGR